MVGWARELSGSAPPGSTARRPRDRKTVIAGHTRVVPWASPPPFEIEAHARQLLELGLQTEGFILARLESHSEASGFVLASQPRKKAACAAR